MKTFLNYMNRPEYLLQPKAILRRFIASPDSVGRMKLVRLNWGLPIEVDTGEAIGILISRSGIFEIPVVESIFRLTDPADIFIDLGANIGLMSSAALAAGAKAVISFEPNPEIHRQLMRNISLWSEAQPRIADRIIPREEAVSDREGKAPLRTPDLRFQGNHGLSSLEECVADECYSEVEVKTITLAKILKQYGEKIGVLKIDIEGHELKVLVACQNLLRGGAVRDIIFEDHKGMNSELSQLLQSLGYSVFNLSKTPIGPALLDSDAPAYWFRVPEDFNFVATLNPERARRKMARRGFMCLRRRNFASQVP
jgi:FkbM family methyltransferase